MLNLNLLKQCRALVSALILAFGVVASAGAQVSVVTPPTTLSSHLSEMELAALHAARAAVAADISHEIADGTMRVVRDAIEESLETRELLEEKAELKWVPFDSGR